MTEDTHTSLSTLFQDWLSCNGVDREPELEAYLAEQAEEQRAALRQMIEDFLVLRQAVESEGEDI